MDLNTLLSRQFVLLDGAMGTQLQLRGLPGGAIPELANLEHPDWLLDIHRAYVEAGADIIYANTFGANREKLARTGHTVNEVVAAGVRLAKQAAGERALVAVDLGPLGQILEPNGTLPFEGAVERFGEMVEAGAQAGADLVVVETMGDLQEAKAAVLAARERCQLPILVTMSFEAGGRTYMGCDIPSMALTLTGLGAAAIGVNCSLGPLQLPPLVEELRRWTPLPLILKPNAGLPNAAGGYDITPEEFADALSRLAAETGVQFLGGCCGTTPDYLARLKQALTGKGRAERTPAVPAALCDGTRALVLDQVRVVGGGIDPAENEDLRTALEDQDMDEVLDLALDQADEGAELLRVKVDEAAAMAETVQTIQSAVHAPLLLYSADPAALEAGLRVCRGKPMVGPVTGEDGTLDAVLPLARKYGAAVLGLPADGNGVPPQAPERLALSRHIVDRAAAAGIPREDVFLLCGTPDAALQTLELIKGQLGVGTVLDLTGLADRDGAQELLQKALAQGLDLAILDPEDEALMGIVQS